MRKREFLEHWRALELTSIHPGVIPYKFRGSTFAEDGIRITGSPQFVDQVLSNLKELLACENSDTRLGVSYQESKWKETGEPTGSISCYIQVHERGREARIANAFFGSPP